MIVRTTPTEGGDRYVQMLIGHGIGHAEASSNVYLRGASRLSADHEDLLRLLGWTPPMHDADDPDELPANWTLPLVKGDWQDLVEVLLATIVGVFGFDQGAPAGRARGVHRDQPVPCMLPGGDRVTEDDVTGYDVIGDVHGHVDTLERLLTELGYERSGGAHRHPEGRQAVFVGDLIDRGPGQVGTLGLVRAMVEAGAAQAVQGNHEFNAVAFATPSARGGWCRPHNPKNRAQHEAFLAEVGWDSPEHRDWVSWFRTLPLWLDLGGVRVVHACWDPASMAVLGDGALTEELVAAPEGSAPYEAIEVVLKGPEIHMGGAEYYDNDGHRRGKARFRWWSPDARTSLRAAAAVPGNAHADAEGRVPFGPLPDRELTDSEQTKLPAPPTDVPVLYGHYWRSGTPRVDVGGKSACLDWSVAQGWSAGRVSLVG